MDRLEALKLLLGIRGGERDELLHFALGAVEDQILAYTGQEALPQALERPLVLMAASYYKGAALGTTEAAPGPVASVSRGNVSTSFAVSAGGEIAGGTFGLSDGDGFFGWRSTLDRFRKARW